MRRRLALSLLLLPAVLSACGYEIDAGGEPKRIPTPTEKQIEAARNAEQPPAVQQPISTALRRRLEGGEIGMVDALGVTQIRPDQVEFAQDAMLVDVKWSKWDATGARGSGTMRFNDCNPNCAEGKTVTVPATITLAEPKSCSGPRYYSKSDVRQESGERPFSYVRAPC